MTFYKWDFYRLYLPAQIAFQHIDSSAIPFQIAELSHGEQAHIAPAKQQTLLDICIQNFTTKSTRRINAFTKYAGKMILLHMYTEKIRLP